MMYEKPIFHIGGDSFVIVELGDDGSLALNLYILTYEKMIWEAKIPGLIDTTALRSTVMVHYDPLVIQGNRMIEYLRDLISGEIKVPGKIPSKIIYLPVYFNDPWTRECAIAHGVAPNVEILADENNISIQEVIQAITQPLWFVSYICFQYGNFQGIPIDPVRLLKNSKYKKPRKWTPAGTLGIGGQSIGFYSLRGPGGIMMLGIIPVKTFDTEGRNSFFKEDPLLIRPGNRVQFFPIESNEYAHIQRHADDYLYKIENGYIESAKYI